jgi:hypothetical protein
MRNGEARDRVFNLAIRYDNVAQMVGWHLVFI